MFSPTGRVEGFNFNSDVKVDEGEEIIKDSGLSDTPTTRGTWDLSRSSQDVFPMSKEFEEILDTFIKLRDDTNKIECQKKKDCDTLIGFAKYVEDVLEVIRVPKDIEYKLIAKSTALVALSPDVLERLQKDFSS